jgi:hypothetical protein
MMKAVNPAFRRSRRINNKISRGVIKGLSLCLGMVSLG